MNIVATLGTQRVQRTERYRIQHGSHKQESKKKKDVCVSERTSRTCYSLDAEDVVARVSHKAFLHSVLKVPVHVQSTPNVHVHVHPN